MATNTTNQQQIILGKSSTWLHKFTHYATSTVYVLTSTLDVTDEVVSQLIELHPTSTSALPMLDEQWSSLFLKEQDVEQYSRRFYDKGALPGPSGWTGAMIIPLLDSVVCRKGLSIVFSQIINGSIPHGTLNQA